MKQVEKDPSGQYVRFDQLLGRGCFKNVYKAFDTNDAVEVAWNKLQVDRIPESQIKKVEFEVELLSRLNHKNIINLHASWRQKTKSGKEGLDFITELMSSGTLKEYLERAKSIKLKVIRRWCHNLLEAITYLHSQDPPVMHRDLKCENIFINGHVGEVKIGDLGLSGVKQEAVAQSVIGTPEFMAPELYEESYTEKVDIYAFGMCILEMLTMEYPYAECENPAQIFRKVFSGERPLSYQRLPRCEIKHVIGACLEPEKRRPSARQLLEHPFFSDWQSDPGIETNLSLIGCAPKPSTMPSANRDEDDNHEKQHTGRNKQRPNEERSRKEESYQNHTDRVPEDSLHRGPSRVESKHGTELLVLLNVPMDGVYRKIEFFFDPTVDDVDEVSAEMASEFQLTHGDLIFIKNEIHTQVAAYLGHGGASKGNSGGSNYQTQYEKSREELRDDNGGRIKTNGRDRASSGARRQRNSMENSNFSGGEDGERDGNVRSNNRDRGDNASRVNRLSRGNQAELNSADIYLPDHDSEDESDTAPDRSSEIIFDRGAFKSNMALMEHCAKGKYGIVEQKLKAGAAAGFADYDRRTPLHLAATEGHADVVALLIENGAHVDSEDRWGSTPLDDAKKNGHEKVVEALVKGGAHVETRDLSKDEINSMELMQYSANGFYDMVREKLMAGVEASFADYDKRTPLHLACAEGHPDIVELLLINAADPMFKDRFGSTPMDEAVKNDRMELLPILQRYGGCLPAHMLNEEDVEFRYGMDLINYASRGKLNRVLYLIEHGADVCFVDYDKRTALHLCCAEGHTDVVAALLKAGADADSKDRWGVSSLDEAEKNKHEKIAFMIKEQFKCSANMSECANGVSNVSKVEVLVTEE